MRTHPKSIVRRTNDADEGQKRQPRVLFLLHGPRPLPPNNRFRHLAEFVEGDILQPVWEPQETVFSPLPDSPLKLHTKFTWSSRPALRILRELYFYIRNGCRLSGSRGFDVIIAFGTTKTALAGCILSRWLGTKFLIEVPVRLERIYLMRSPSPDFQDRIRSGLNCLMARLLLPMADRLHLMYPNQIDYFQAAKRIPRNAFPDFVPVSSLPTPSDGGTILTIGSPLYLKGADIVIRAFQRLADFKCVRLVVAGQARDESYFQRLAAGNPQISFIGHVSREEALECIAAASLVVIASRTDAMPRVAMEAMALGKPIIASRVDGLAAYMKDGENSLLVDPEDVSGLERALRRILSDSRLGSSLAAKARKEAHHLFSEASYTQAFVRMLQETLKSDSSRDVSPKGLRGRHI